MKCSTVYAILLLKINQQQKTNQNDIKNENWKQNIGWFLNEVDI